MSKKSGKAISLIRTRIQELVNNGYLAGVNNLIFVRREVGNYKMNGGAGSRQIFLLK
jgi:hypothetical protein